MSGVPSWAPLALDPVPREAIARRSLLGAVAAAGVCPEALPAGGAPRRRPGNWVAGWRSLPQQLDSGILSSHLLRSCNHAPVTGGCEVFGCFGAIACQAGGLSCPVVSGYMDSWEQGYKCHWMTLKVAECQIRDLAALVLV